MRRGSAVAVDLLLGRAPPRSFRPAVTRVAPVAPGAADSPCRAASARGRRSCRRSPRGRGARPGGRRASGGPGTGAPRPGGAGSTSQRSSRRSSIVALIPPLSAGRHRWLSASGRWGCVRELRPGRGEGEGPAGGPLARTAQPRGAGGFPPVGRGVAPNLLYLSHIATIIARSVRPPVKGKARKMDISKLTHGAKLVLGGTIVFLIVSFFNWHQSTMPATAHRREHVARHAACWPACSRSRSSSGRGSASPT